MSQIVPIHANASQPSAIDIESIVRRVLAQLRETSEIVAEKPSTPPTLPIITQRVFSLEDVRGLTIDTKHIVVSTKTIITPAAKDELRQRGINVEKTSDTKTPTATPPPQDVPGTRAIDLQRDGDIGDGMLAAIKKQITTRGVRLCDQASVTVILSDRPATTAHSRIHPEACIVSINRVDDVSRFISELSPNVFVLDTKHLHLVSLASAISAIAKPALSASGHRPQITVSGSML